MSAVASKSFHPSIFRPVVNAMQHRPGAFSPSFRAISQLETDYAFSPQSLRHSAPRLENYPTLMRRAFLVEKQMQTDLFSCVHAQPAPFTLPMRLISALEKSGPFFKRLRGHDEIYNSSCSQIKKIVGQAFQKGKTDEAWEVRPFVISCNYALLGNFEQEESAIWWGFNPGFNQKGSEAAQRMLKQALQAQKLSDEHVSDLLQKASPILNGYANLQVANFLIIGVPFALMNKVAYDSLAYGKATGAAIVAAHEQTQVWIKQLRLVMGQETLDSRFGVRVVIANQQDEADSFCKDTALSSDEKTFLKTWIKPGTSKDEERECQQRKMLDDKTRTFINDVQQKLHDQKLQP